MSETRVLADGLGFPESALWRDGHARLCNWGAGGAAQRRRLDHKCGSIRQCRLCCDAKCRRCLGAHGLSLRGGSAHQLAGLAASRGQGSSCLWLLSSIGAFCKAALQLGQTGAPDAPPRRHLHSGVARHGRAGQGALDIPGRESDLDLRDFGGCASHDAASASIYSLSSSGCDCAVTLDHARRECTCPPARVALAPGQGVRFGTFGPGRSRAWGGFSGHGSGRQPGSGR